MGQKVISEDNNKGIERIEASGQQLREISSEVLHLTTLVYLFLDRNQLTCIPPQISNLSSLQLLSLDFNRLRDLRSEMGDLCSLHSLSLKNNTLTSIPPQLSNLSGLHYLSLDSHTYLHKWGG